MNYSINPPQHKTGGNVIAALFFFSTTAVLYFFSFLMLPWPVAVLIHLWAIVNAATYRG